MHGPPDPGLVEVGLFMVKEVILVLVDFFICMAKKRAASSVSFLTILTTS